MAFVALAHLVEPGRRDLGVLVRQVGATAALERLLAGEVDDNLRQIVEPRLVHIAPRGTVAEALLHAARATVRADRLGVDLLTPLDDGWPHQLRDLVRLSRDNGRIVDRDTDPPLCLWVRGAEPLADACDRSVSVIGARAATAYGEHMASELAYGLAQRGWTVVSGGAFGIDAAAHRGALAAGGVTIAILACGVDRPYPLSLSGMFERIVDGGGLLLSEWPPGSDPHRVRFLVRNRVIAALTRGTVMVEAGKRSGARFTLHRAIRLGRPALVVPGPATSESSVGCHEELRAEGTRLVATVADIVEEVGRIGLDLADEVRAPERTLDVLTGLQAQVLDGVRPRAARTAEEVAAAAGVAIRDARATLPALVDLGFVVCHDGRYRLAPAP
ncbi:DNA-processing protein DprA [Luedemannella flava]|uniref:DNA-processing protein DprA n=1 Tax=Luedemannella flava TaxID=349316 RepID=UPI003CD0B5B1